MVPQLYTLKLNWIPKVCHADNEKLYNGMLMGIVFSLIMHCFLPVLQRYVCNVTNLIEDKIILKFIFIMVRSLLRLIKRQQFQSNLCCRWESSTWGHDLQIVRLILYFILLYFQCCWFESTASLVVHNWEYKERRWHSSKSIKSVCLWGLNSHSMSKVK